MIYQTKKNTTKKREKIKRKRKKHSRETMKGSPSLEVKGFKKKKKNGGWHILPSFRLLSISYASDRSFDFSICMKWLECSRAKTLTCLKQLKTHIQHPGGKTCLKEGEAFNLEIWTVIHIHTARLRLTKCLQGHQTGPATDPTSQQSSPQCSTANCTQQLGLDSSSEPPMSAHHNTPQHASWFF